MHQKTKKIGLFNVLIPLSENNFMLGNFKYQIMNFIKKLDKTCNSYLTTLENLEKSQKDESS